MIKLTSLSSCAGCAAKLPQDALREVLRDLPQSRDRNLLVGSSTADDAGVFRIDRDRALVQTVDFFTPIVDDPFFYGQSQPQMRSPMSTRWEAGRSRR